jgi:hypothetical protein
MIVFVLAHKDIWMSYAVWENNEIILRYDKVPSRMYIFAEPGHMYEANPDYTYMAEIKDPITRLTLIDKLIHKLENKVYLHKLTINLYDANITIGDNYTRAKHAVITLAENLSNNQIIVTLVQPEFMPINDYIYFEETDNLLVTITNTLELYSAHKAYPIHDITFNYLKLHKASLEHDTLYNVYKGNHKLTDILQWYKTELNTLYLSPVKIEIKIFDYLTPVHDSEMRYCSNCKFSCISSKGGIILPCHNCRQATLTPTNFLYMDEHTSHYLGADTYLGNEQFNSKVILGITSEDKTNITTYFLYDLKVNYNVKRKLQFKLRLNKS